MTSDKLKFYLLITFAFLLGIVDDHLFFKKSIGISFFVFILLLSFFSVILAERFERKIKKDQLFLLVAAVLLSMNVFLRSSGFLTFFNVMGTFYLLIGFFFLFLGHSFQNLRIIDYFIAPFRVAIDAFFGASKYIEKHREQLETKRSFGSPEFWGVIKGAIIALPFLFIFISLFASADKVFDAYLARLINIKIDVNLAEWAYRLFKIFLVSYFLVGVFSLIGRDRNKDESQVQHSSKKLLGFTESVTVLVLVELLFFSFIIIQFYYLFGGKNYVWGLDEYITYSEYARSGFNELIMIAIISFMLIFGLDKFGAKESIKEKNLFKFLSVALVAEIVVILFSSFSRLSLYVDGYGLTIARFLAYAMLFWILAALVIFIYKIISERKEGFFLAGLLSMTAVFWILMNFINPDSFIAAKNLERLEAGKKLDPTYFSALSDDAVPQIVKVFSSRADDETKETIAGFLYWRYDSTYKYPCDIYSYTQCTAVTFRQLLDDAEKDKPWQSFNLSRASAIKALRENYDMIAKYQSRYWKKEVTRCQERAGQCIKNCEENDYPRISSQSCETYCRGETDNKVCENFAKRIEVRE